MKVIRNLLREFYGIPAGETTTYHYINPGFTKNEESNSPQVDKTAFLGDVNSHVTITGYENAFAFEAQYISDDPVVADIVSIATGQKTGADCERVLVSVDMSQTPTEGAYPARKMDIVVETTGPSGEPRGITKINGNFHQNGDIVAGTFNPTTLVFTAAA